ncbi:DGQHR domain-containing protein [Deinococcus sp. AJ005]|uniref:DGQHR domain-containing protein n=1 Tax=Deinococcus sp. AJ005 TaxID=2652443 RepID=UPI00125CC333|nr:DGQHR domain-containing protein [Deinococcus sp. AJ005]QFP77596.1 DGQHR domain-containing protein [Deinococcus sp. AJ005]
MLLYPDNIKSIEFPAIEISQPIGSFFIAAIPAQQLYSISYADVRRIEGEERGFETYLGIQRPLSNKRVKEIKQYVETIDASFPTSIIIAINGNCAKFLDGLMTLSSYEGDSDTSEIHFNQIARIIDGQHRLAGLEGYSGAEFMIPVTIFIDMDVADQAYVFSTVNLAQTKVNKSLAYDLFDYATQRSPQKAAHNIVVALNSDPESPFFRRVKRLGSATDGNFIETLTQAAFVENILKYITRNPLKDRDDLKRGKKLKFDPSKDHDLIFRELFIEQKDFVIAEIINNYFSSIRERYPEAWNDISRGAVLSKTNAFMAFMRFLPEALEVLGLSSRNLIDVKLAPRIAEFSTLLSNLTLDDADFTVETFKPGSSGSALLYRTLKDQVLRSNTR